MWPKRGKNNARAREGVEFCVAILSNFKQSFQEEGIGILTQEANKTYKT